MAEDFAANDFEESQNDFEAENFDEIPEEVEPSSGPANDADFTYEYETGEDDDEPSLGDDEPSDEPAEDIEPAEEEGGDIEAGNAPAYDPGVVQRAVNLGWSRQDVEMFTPQGLAAAVSRGEREHAAMVQAATNKDNAPEQKNEWDLELPEDEFDEKLVKQLKGMKEHFQSQMQAMAQQNQMMGGVLGQMVQKAQNEQAQVFRQRLDGWVDKQGEAWEDVFGKGSIDAMKPDSKPAQNRIKVVQQLAALANGYQTSGQPLPPEDVLLEMARDAAFPEKRTASERNKIASTLKKNKSQFTARTTKQARGQKQKSKSPEQRAREHVEKILRKAEG